jgi:hypothetical protein
MILIYANHSSDWKYRADHRVKIVATGTRQELEKKRDEEIRELFVEDLMNDFENDCDGKPSQKAVNALKRQLSKLGMKKLHKRWENMDGDGPQRWKMKSSDKSQCLFCGGYEGESWGCSWTIIDG